MDVYCDGNECKLIPRARVVYPPLLEGEVRPSIAPSNVTADIAPLRHEATEDRDAEECSIAAQDARNGGANLRQRQQPSSGSEAVRTLTQIVSTFKDVKEDDHSDSGSHDEAGLLVEQDEQPQVSRVTVLKKHGVCCICNHKGNLYERGVCKSCQDKLWYLMPPVS